MSEDPKRSTYDRIIDWFDERIGFKKTPLRPIPEFMMNPAYWLGLLMALSFAIQIVTGIFMLLYYDPSPTTAYSSTIYIIQSVPLGHLVETVHLYNAYAMILLAMIHLMRNYFGSCYKKPREFMWLAGWVLFILTLGLGLTGYLLPWTVVSKSATDVAIGFLNYLPQGLSSLIQSLVTGSGSDADLIQHFFVIHTVILPWTLAAFLAAKIYMFEVHGSSYVRAYGKGSPEMRPWFPTVFLYALMLFSAFIATILTISTLFPLTLPPMFTPQLASQYAVQPDWYLLWVYQILKFQAFGGAYVVIGLAAIAVFLITFALLPFIDRSKRRDPSNRPIQVAIGAIIVAEFVILTIWGYLTPGQDIPAWEAVIVLGLPILVIAENTWVLFRKQRKSAECLNNAYQVTATRLALRTNKLGSLYLKFTGVFAVLLVVASASLATLVNNLSNILSSAPLIAATVFLVASSFYIMYRMFGRLVMFYEGGKRS